MSRIYIGIDCGLDGALAAIGTDPNPGVAFHDTPTLETGHGSRRTYDIPAMAKILDEYNYSDQCMAFAEPKPGCCRRHDGVIVALETQQSMPKQGVASTFSTGFGYGVWQGLLTAMKIPYRLVRPVAWKKEMMAGEPKDKAASCLVAGRLWPSAAGDLKTERGRALHGRADALLLAEFMRRHDGSRDADPS